MTEQLELFENVRGKTYQDRVTFRRQVIRNAMVYLKKFHPKKYDLDYNRKKHLTLYDKKERESFQVTLEGLLHLISTYFRIDRKLQRYV